MSGREVTGRWEGIFNYPRALPPNGFVAELIEQAGAIGGTVEEVNDEPGRAGGPIAATIDGARIGSAIRFTKRYDDPTRADHPVLYEGTLAPEGDEIVGEWSIPGVWSGSFIMVRRVGEAVPAEAVVADAAP